tara:strand:+ start:84170 stop:84367 length:198 start_codon:yes stop_codon:yes gene_type:complete
MKGAHAPLDQFAHKTLIGYSALFDFGLHCIQFASRKPQIDGRAFVLELEIYRFEVRQIEFLQIHC